MMKLKEKKEVAGSNKRKVILLLSFLLPFLFVFLILGFAFFVDIDQGLNYERSIGAPNLPSYFVVAKDAAVGACLFAIPAGLVGLIITLLAFYFEVLEKKWKA